MAKPKYPRSPDGDWISPNPKEYEKFWDSVQEQANRLFGVNEEDTPCVMVTLLDRTREERLQWMEVPIDIQECYNHPFGDRKWKGNGMTKVTHTPEEEEVRRIALLENKKMRTRMILGNVETAAMYLRRFGNEMERE